MQPQNKQRQTRATEAVHANLCFALAGTCSDFRRAVDRKLTALAEGRISAASPRLTSPSGLAILSLRLSTV